MIIRLKTKRSRVLFVTGTFLAISIAFNNCAQPGGISIVTPDNEQGSGEEVTGSYVSKSKSVSIDAFHNNKVDLLVVIDNSGSMKTEQQNMAARFSTLLDQLDGLDWQVGVVTTDVTDDNQLRDGRLLKSTSGNYILTSKMSPDLAKAEFAQIIQRPEEGSSSEQGIKATYRTLERAIDSSMQAVNQPNRDLIRNDAALAVLVVTDANETPQKYDKRNSGSELVNFVTDTWKGKKNFVFNSIVVNSGDSACLSKDGNEGYGFDYEKLSKATNGFIGTVCATDYGSQLKVIGETVVEQVQSIMLECAPADSDGDGNLNILVRHKSPMGIIQTLTDYKVEGLSLKFSTSPPEGVIDIQYSCKK